VRALLAAAGVLVALVLLGPSPLAAAVEGPRAPVAGALTATTGGAASMEAPRSAALLRTTAVAVLPAPVGPAGGLLPAHGPYVAPHLVAEPPPRARTGGLATSAPHGISSRAPPGPAGT
jgi:di/tricarboxylate transporter